MSKSKAMLAAAGLLVCLGIASPVYADQVTFFPPVTQFEDDDLDWLLNADGTLDTDGIIDEGDRLVGVVEYNTTSGVFGGGSADVTPGELTGVFDITVVDKIDNLDGTFDFIFGPTAGSTFLAAGAPVGTMATLWLDDTDNLDLLTVNSCNSLAACVDLANDDTVYLNVGFNGDPNQLWAAFDAQDNIALVAGAPASSKLGFFNFFLNVLTNNTGQTLENQLCAPLCPVGGDNSVQLIGSGDILGGQGWTNGAFARSDTDFQLQTPIPEPSSVLLLGTGLLGLGLAARRRLKK